MESALGDTPGGLRRPSMDPHLPLEAHVQQTRPDGSEPPKGSTTVRRHRLVLACILAIGWSLSIAKYVTAVPITESDAVYEMEHSKRDLRQLEEFGGKAAVLTSDFNQWFGSIWHGRALAYTMAVLTVVVAAGYGLLSYLSCDDTAPPE